MNTNLKIYPPFTQADADRIRANFPSNLLTLKYWVAWEWIERPGKPKPTKKPINPHTGSGAKSNDPQTWCSFDQAATYALKRKIRGGIGFMFAPPYVGIDFDHCVEEGVIDPQRLADVERLHSYTEYSPSKTGLHIICIGTLPPEGRKNSKLDIEVYTEGRFFTVTGERLNGFHEVKDCPDILKELHANWFLPKQVTRQKKVHGNKLVKLSDDQVWSHMFAAKNGKRWKRLFKGEWENYYASQSEADFAFVGALGFWTSLDPERMDFLFRKSGLYRTKWDEIHYNSGKTYGEITIEKASANVRPEDCYRALKPQLT